MKHHLLFLSFALWAYICFNIKNVKRSWTWLNWLDCFSTINVVRATILQPEATGNLGTVKLWVAKTNNCINLEEKRESSAVCQTKGAESCRFDRNTSERNEMLGENIIILYFLVSVIFHDLPGGGPYFGRRQTQTGIEDMVYSTNPSYWGNNMEERVFFIYSYFLSVNRTRRCWCAMNYAEGVKNPLNHVSEALQWPHHSRHKGLWPLQKWLNTLLINLSKRPQPNEHNI